MLIYCFKPSIQLAHTDTSWRICVMLDSTCVNIVHGTALNCWQNKRGKKYKIFQIFDI